MSFDDTVETSKAIFSRLYESYKLFNDNSKLLCIFNMVRGKLMIAISTIYCEIALIFNY